MKPFRNRIVRHVRIRADQLVPHELNPHVHSEAQRQVLAKLYDEIGFARSLLAYQLEDGRLKLIDGHLRAALTPEQEVDVEVLDVNDAEARILMLAIDPLAQLSGCDPDQLDELRVMVEADSAAIQSLFQVVAEANRRTQAGLRTFSQNDEPFEQFYVLIECDDEAQQRALLERFQREGLKCQAKVA